MPKVNFNDYVEIVKDINDHSDLNECQLDKDYIKFEKIKIKKNHFKERRNAEKLRDIQKNHRILRPDKV